MTRTVRDSKLETRAARARLPAQPKPHWKTLEPGKLHLGYRRKHKDLPGQWLARRYRGGERYQVRPLGLADDFQDGGAGILNYAEAQRAAHEVRWSGVPRRAATGAPTVADAIGRYVAWLRENRATANDAEIRAQIHILPKLGAAKLVELTTDDINAWMTTMAAAPARLRGKNQKRPATTKEDKRARRASANRVLTYLKAALNMAFRDGLVANDTAWRRVKPFDKTNAARPGHLTKAECKRLINAADAASGFRDLVTAALLSGARYSELRALQVRDFVNGKLHVRTSKSGRPRFIVLTEEGTAFFTALTTGRAGTDWLLLRNGEPWRASAQARPMQEACAAAKIVPPIGLHALRHTYASLAVMAEMPLPVLAANMGHASTRMIEAHYGHLRESYVDEAIKSAAPRFDIVLPKSNVIRRRV